MAEGCIFRCGFRIEKHGMALVESASAAVLSAQSNRNPLAQKRTKDQSLRHSEIHGALAACHLKPLLDKALDFGVDVKTFRRARE